MKESCKCGKGEWRSLLVTSDGTVIFYCTGCTKQVRKNIVKK